MGIYRTQYDAGQLFLHEHLDRASSWKEKRNGRVNGTARRLHSQRTYVPLVDASYKQKRTSWFWLRAEDDKLGKRSPEQHFRRRMASTCSLDRRIGTGSSEIPSGFGEGRAENFEGAANQQRRALVKAVLKTLKEGLNSRGELSSFDAGHAVPVVDELLFDDEDWDTFYGDIHGAALTTDLVHAARSEEFAWIRKEKI